MAAPVATPRGTPTGIMLKDGFSTKVTFASNPTIEFWEKKVTPPGLDGGAAVEQTTMHNVTYRTMAPRTLKTMTEMTLVASYDPSLYTSILALINKRTTVTVTFPDGSTVAFFGFLMHFKPASNEEGKQPEAEIAIMPTNADPVTGAEQAAVIVSVPGT